MTDLSKIDMINLRKTTNPDQAASAGLERGDIGQLCHGDALHTQLSRRLRTIFAMPEEPENAFDSVLKEISDRLP